MSQSEDKEISVPLIGGLVVEDLARSAFFGFALGAILFVVSDQTDVIRSTLSKMGFLNAARYLGVKQLVIFGMVLGVGLGLAGRFFSRGRSDGPVQQ